MQMLKGVLDGEAGAPADIVVLNAGAALYAANVTASIVDGIALARQAIASGAARRTLDALVKATHAA
jgi:anthranilate phosphoribosyltransferase